MTLHVNRVALPVSGYNGIVIPLRGGFGQWARDTKLS